MHKAQKQVEKFHKAFGMPVQKKKIVIPQRNELRAKLIMEEAVETAEALTGWEIRWDWHGGSPTPGYGNREKVIDGMCDILVVTYGCAVEMGVDLRPYFDEVNKTNMAKVGGPVRADGKQLKPKGWKKPDIAKMLEKGVGTR